MDGLSLGREIQRKSIHLATSLIPLAYISLLPKKESIFLICIILAIGFLSVDLLRLNWTVAGKYFMKIFSVLLRENESEDRLTGATYLFIGMTAAVFLFPKEIAVSVLLFLTIADPMAAIVGKKMPVKKIFNKSLGGFIGFFLCAVLITAIVSRFSLIALIVSFIAAVVELVPLKVNDNLTIPVISGYVFLLLK